jgi:hypothetical protein
MDDDKDGPVPEEPALPSLPASPLDADAEGSAKARSPCTSPVVASTPRRLAISAIKPALTVGGC